MALVPWRSYRGFSTFSHEMDRLFDRFFGRDLAEHTCGFVSHSDLTIMEKEDEILLSLEVEGFSPQEIEVTFTGNLLTIKGEKREGEVCETPEGHSHRKESSSFIRTVHISERIQPDRIKAHYKNGKLFVKLPKAKEKSIARIRIE